MSGDVQITFAADDKGLLALIAKSLAQLRALEAAGAGVEGGIGKADRGLQRFADSIKNQVMTPLERFKQAKERLGQALSKDLIDNPTYARGLAAELERYRQEIKQTEGEWERYAAAVKEANQTPVERLQAKLDKLSEAHKRNALDAKDYDRAVKAAHAEHQREIDRTQAKLARENDVARRSQFSFSASAVAAGQLVAGAWQSAIGMIGRFSQAMRQEQQAALQVQRDAGGSLGMLAQIADSPEHMAQLTEQARGLVRSGSAQTVGQGAQIVFDLANAGALEELPQLRRLSDPGIVRDLGVAATAAKSMQNAFGEKVGGIADIMAKSLVAAKFSAANAEQLSTGAARAGSAASDRGMTIDELLAATAIVGDVRGSAEEGGTRIASLLRGMEDDMEVRGKSLMESIQVIQSRNLAPEELTKQLTAEGADAFRILTTNLQKLDEITRATAEQVTAVTIAEKERLALGERAVRTDLEARRAKAMIDLQREDEGRVVQMQEAMIAVGEMERRTGNRGGIATMARDAAAALDPSFFDKLGPAGLLLKMNARTVGALPDRVTRELDAMAFGNAMGGFGAVPGNALPEAMAGSDRGLPGLREALKEAIVARDEGQKQFAAEMRKVAADFREATARLSRPGLGRAAQREAAVAAGGD